MLRKILATVLGILLLVFVVLWIFFDPPLSSPLSESETSRFLNIFPKKNAEKIIYGFLPYWNMDTVVIQPELTHLAYFSLTIAEDGTIVTQSGGGTEPGYRQFQSEEFFALNSSVKAKGGKLHVVFSQFGNDAIATFLGSPAAQQAFLTSLDSVLLAYPVNGINLDIEYAGDAPPALREQYTQFVSLVSRHLDETYENVELTIDAYAAAASKHMLWDIEKIAPLVDYIVVMAYDFHTRSSARSGPVAPLLSDGETWSESINGYLKAYTQKVSPEKILLGVPFYGYEWQTTSAEPQSFTFPQTGATASYRRVSELLARKEELQLQEHWDEAALSPYLTYTQNGNHYTVYYENAQSVAYKLEYVRQLDLAGIAIWSLGYDGPSRDLWESIDAELGIE